MLQESKFVIPVNHKCLGTHCIMIIIDDVQVDTCVTTNLLLGYVASDLPDIMAEKGGNVHSSTVESNVIRLPLDTFFLSSF